MDALTPDWSRISNQVASAAARVAWIAARQHGVVSHRQLITAGLAKSTIHGWVRAGHLHRLHRGVYAVGHRSVARDGHLMAAVLACGPHAALSHASAAQHLGLDRTFALGTIHVSVPPPHRRSPRGLLVHHPRELELRDITRHRGIPTTTATRAIFDLCSTVSAGALRRHLEQAEYLHLLDRPRLATLLDGATGRRGLGTLRELLAERPLPLGDTRSRLERLLLRICRDHDLPIPAVNVPLLGYEVDFLWPAARFVVEADGGQHRGRQRDRDNERDLVLARAGYLVRRYSGEALKDGRAVAREILAILRERLPAAR